MGGKKEKYLIALAGLFHDIGKFYQRANPKKENVPQQFHQLLNKDVYSKEFGYQHALYSYIAVKSELYEGLSSAFSPEEIEVIIEGVYHHKPKNNFQHLMQKADWVSSSERDDIPMESNTDYISEQDRKAFEEFAQKNPRLRSIFENLNIGKNYEKKNYFYKISPLNLSEDIFPDDLENAFIDVEKESKPKEKVLGSYSKHWKDFAKEFNQKLKNSKLKFSENPERIFSLIYHLLYKYLWCIPASTYDKENYGKHYPDISLFDHSRVLSAVACCFYDFDKDMYTQKSMDKFKEEFTSKEVFLHIKGDINGIQKFIYNVYEGKGGVAKTLRGRSFYVTLLPEVLSRYILNELGYPISNLLYSGGGIFEIIVANTEENRKKLSEIKEKINKFLSEKFEADIGLSVGTYEYSPVEMMEDYSTVLNKLNENLDNAKKQKFSSLIETGEIFELLNKRAENIHSNKKKCPVCQTYLVDENLSGDKEICNVCKEFKDIGTNLPKTETLVFAKTRTQNFIDDKKIIDFGDFGIVYLISKDNYADLQPIYFDKETTEILDINNTTLDKYTTGFKFIGKTVPEVLEDLSSNETGEEETIHKGQIAPFTYLAKQSDGDERIGILRMDVDNLGKLFSNGLGNKISISRIATLSRTLDLFFSGYLNRICDDLTEKYPKNLKIKNLFYILYSGGDDVFIVSPWDKGVDLAVKIWEEFKKYTCNNPNVTISAGYVQTKPKFPIRVSADIAGDAEKKAKDSGRNRICIMGDLFIWDRLEEAKGKAQEWVDYIKDSKLQRGFIYAVHRLKEQFLKDRDSAETGILFPYSKKENPMFYPYAQYYVARNIKNKELKEKIAKFLLDKNNFKTLTFIINYTFLKTRK